MRYIRAQITALSNFWIIFIVTFAALPMVSYAALNEQTITKESIMNKNDTGLTLLDKNGTPFFTFYTVKRKIFVPLKELPPYITYSTIAIEDKDFYQHQGYSLRGIARSIVTNLREQKLIAGGSTITQQLVKNSMLSADRNLIRKYKEIVLAQEIEKRFSKNEIFEMYINSVYFGEGAFGIEAAAETYFGKHASQLTLAESSLLSGLLIAPSELSPLSHPSKDAFKRQELVLSEMVIQHYITQEQKEAAINQPLTFKTARNNLNIYAPHFALMLWDELIHKYGAEELSRSGMRVITTLDLKTQLLAEQSLHDQLEKLKGAGATNGAVVVIEPQNGYVSALVGSKDWYDERFGKMNMAITPRQSGSAFKPIIYAAALDTGVITPATVLNDLPTTFPGRYTPKDYDGNYRGPVLVRRALANSLNIPSVEIMKRVGIENGLEMGRRMGLTTLGKPSDNGFSLVLGTAEVPLIELTNAYAVFARGGTYQPYTLIKEIADKYGQVIYTTNTNPQPVIKPETAFSISSILSDNFARMELFGTSLNNTVGAAVKTGTSENYQNALTVGYTKDAVVGVWVGNNDNRPMNSIAGSLGAAPVWRDVIESVSPPSKTALWQPPEDMIALQICKYNGLIARAATSSAQLEYFVKGTEPKGVCYWDQTPIASNSAMILPENKPSPIPANNRNTANFPSPNESIRYPVLISAKKEFFFELTDSADKTIKKQSKLLP